MRVLVTGVTGQVGGAVADRLLAHGVHVRGLVRPGSLERVTAAYSVCEGDLNDPESLRDAMQGCASVFLSSSIDRDQVRLQGNLVQAAATSELRPLVVKLSGLGTTAASFVDSGRWHAQTEAEIADAGLPGVGLRPLFFMQNLRRPLQQAVESGVLRGQDGVEVAMVDVGDIADVAATLLRQPERKGFETMTLTGPAAYSFRVVADTMSRVLDRQVHFEATTDEQSRKALSDASMPEWHIEIMSQFRQAFAKGWGSGTTTDVADLLGRDPVDLEQSLRSMLEV